MGVGGFWEFGWFRVWGLELRRSGVLGALGGFGFRVLVFWRAGDVVFQGLGSLGVPGLGVLGVKVV